MNARMRKLIGTVVLLVFLALYAWAAMAIGAGRVMLAPAWMQFACSLSMPAKDLNFPLFICLTWASGTFLHHARSITVRLQPGCVFWDTRPVRASLNEREILRQGAA